MNWCFWPGTYLARPGLCYIHHWLAPQSYECTIAVFTIVANGFGIYTAEKHVAYCIDLYNSYRINKIRLTHSSLTCVSTDKAQLSQNNCIQADCRWLALPLLTSCHTGPQNTVTWGSWSSWSTCSQTCNGGICYRTRSCVGGTTCTGSNIEKRRCNTNPCSSKCRLFYFNAIDTL